MAEIKDFNTVDVEELFPSEETVETSEENTETSEEKIEPQPLVENASIDDLFPDEEKENKKEKSKDEANVASEEDNSSLNRYAELSKILLEEGVLDNLEEDDLADVTDADSFKALIVEQINRGLDEKQREIQEALTNGVKPSVIQTYQNAMATIRNIEPVVTEESEEGKRARANLIYQDYLNKGIKDAKARSLVQASMSAGTDIEDAQEALDSLKQFYQDAYHEALEDAKFEKEEEQRLVVEQNELLKKNLLDKKDLFGGISIDKNTRQKAYSSVAKATAKSSDGVPLTAVQKYANDNPVEFRTIVGLMYAMTDGFTNMNKIFNKAVDKKVHSKLDDLTRKLTSSTSQNGEGGIRYKNGPAEELLDTNRWRVFL